MTIGELKRELAKYSNDMEVLVEGALGEGFSIEDVNYGCDVKGGKVEREFVCLYSPYVVNALEDALGEDL